MIQKTITRSLLRVGFGLSVLFAAGSAAAQADPMLLSLSRSNIEHHSGWIEFAEGMASQADLPAASREYYRQVANRHERLRSLNQQEVASLEAENAASIDPKAEAVSGPLKDYLERQEAHARDPKANAVSGPLEDYLELIEAQRQQADAASAVLDSAGEGGRAGQRFGTGRAREAGARIADGRDFTRIVVNSTGETIVNDRADVLEAKLEDLSRRQEGLERSASTTLGVQAQRKVRVALIALDREIRQVMEELARLLVRRAVRAAAVCAVNNTKVMVTGCEFWARKLPLIIPQGHGNPIFLDHALLEITETKGRLVSWRMNLWYRDQNQPGLDRTDEPTHGYYGDLRANADGTYSMLVPVTDEHGDERIQAIALQLDKWTATAAGVDFIDQKRPLQLRFDRDWDNFVLLDGSKMSKQEALRILGYKGTNDFDAARAMKEAPPRKSRSLSKPKIRNEAPAKPSLGTVERRDALTTADQMAPVSRTVSSTNIVAEGIKATVKDSLKETTRKLFNKLPF